MQDDGNQPDNGSPNKRRERFLANLPGPCYDIGWSEEIGWAMVGIRELLADPVPARVSHRHRGQHINALFLS